MSDLGLRAWKVKTGKKAGTKLICKWHGEDIVRFALTRIG